MVEALPVWSHGVTLRKIRTIPSYANTPSVLSRRYWSLAPCAFNPNGTGTFLSPIRAIAGDRNVPPPDIRLPGMDLEDDGGYNDRT